MTTIDPTIERHVQLTDAQRAVIAKHGLTVTFEFGHVCIMTDSFAAKIVAAKGKARQALVATNDPEAGRVHDDPQHFGDLLEAMVYERNTADLLRDCGQDDGEAGASYTEMEAETATPGQTEHVVEVVAPKGRKPRVLKAAVEQAVAATTAAVAANPQAHAPAPKSGGVIGALVALLSDGTKRTRGELYDALAAQFPDRATPEGGMRITIGVQLNALKKKGHKIQVDADKKYWI